MQRIRNPMLVSKAPLCRQPDTRLWRRPGSEVMFRGVMGGNVSVFSCLPPSFRMSDISYYILFLTHVFNFNSFPYNANFQGGALSSGGFSFIFRQSLRFYFFYRYIPVLLGAVSRRVTSWNMSDRVTLVTFGTSLFCWGPYFCFSKKSVLVCHLDIKIPIFYFCNTFAFFLFRAFHCVWEFL